MVKRLTFALAGGLVVVLVACSQPAPTPAPPGPPPMTQVQRGLYIVNAAGCNDCHTPAKMGPNGPEPDMSRMLSGHPENIKVETPPKMSGGWMAVAYGTFTAWAGPWGISYTANLTPDPSGLSAWDENMFITAIRTGKHMGKSRPILPPMPWPAFKNYSDDDLKAIFAYLKTIPPVSNHVPEPVIAEPPPGKGK